MTKEVLKQSSCIFTSVVVVVVVVVVVSLLLRSNFPAPFACIDRFAAVSRRSSSVDRDLSGSSLGLRSSAQLQFHYKLSPSTTILSVDKMPEFQQGLFGCFSNCSVCIITYFCPCYTEGKIAEKVGESCLLHALILFVPIANLICATSIRGKVRENKGIEGSLVSDCLSIWCCFGCALCQEAHEVDALGRNMAQSMARE